MIILDTNMLWGVTPDNASADLLKTIRATGAQGVAVPWTVMEELAAQKALRHQDKYDAAHAALNALQANTPWDIGMQLPKYEPERVRQHWRKSFGAIVDVLPLSAQVLQEAAFREANVLPPCKRLDAKGVNKPVKTGARDAAIWLTAVEFARQHPDETVYFISKNTDDFGNGKSYEEPMRSDLKGLGDRFKHYTTLDPVVDQFTQPTEMDEAVVLERLGAPATMATIARDAGTRWQFELGKFDTGPIRFIGSQWSGVSTDDSGGQAETIAVRGWVTTPLAHLGSVKDVSAYRIGDHLWCTATVSWLLTGLALSGSEFQVNRVGCAWNTRVLLSPTNADSEITVLRSDLPKPIDAEQFRSLQDPLSAPEVNGDSYTPESMWKNLAELEPGHESTGLASIVALVALGVASYTRLRRDRGDS